MGEIVDHDAKDIDDGMESFIGVTNIRKADFVQKNLLDNKYSNRLGQFSPVLHDA